MAFFLELSARLVAPSGPCCAPKVNVIPSIIISIIPTTIISPPHT